MKKNEEIELSSIESTAYWWINMIRNKVRELIIEGTDNRNEREFVKIFYRFTEIDWRNLYLELINYITEDVNNYVLIGTTLQIDSFNQDTDVKGHNRINEELSKIMKCSIPDIRLAGGCNKDFVIYTNIFGACVWYKSCGTMDLPTKYEPCYILTGNRKELDFYNLFLATVAKISELDQEFNSIPLLKERFCNEYKLVNMLEESIDEIVELFDKAFSDANDKGIIFGRRWDSTYFPHFREIDYIGLEEYMDDAKHYADVVLQRSKNNGAVGYSKIFKVNPELK